MIYKVFSKSLTVYAKLLLAVEPFKGRERNFNVTGYGYLPRASNPTIYTDFLIQAVNLLKYAEIINTKAIQTVTIST